MKKWHENRAADIGLRAGAPPSSVSAGCLP